MIIIQKTSINLWHYHRDELDATLTNSEPFKSKVKIIGSTPANGNKKNVETSVPIKFLSNFIWILEMLLINCEINLILTWSSTCIITNSTVVGLQ